MRREAYDEGEADASAGCRGDDQSPGATRPQEGHNVKLLIEVAKSVTAAWHDAGVHRPSMRNWHAYAEDGVPVVSTWAPNLYVSTEGQSYECYVKPTFVRKLSVGQKVRLVMIEQARRDPPTRTRPNGIAVAGKGATLPGLFTVREIGTELLEDHYYLVKVSR
jgi:hypothetical protein